MKVDIVVEEPKRPDSFSEAISQIEGTKEYLARSESPVCHMCVFCLADAIKILKSVPADEWIPVEDRLPRSTGRYIGWNAALKEAVPVFFEMDGTYFEEDCPWSDGDAELYEDITHWRPYPDGPKGGDE